MAESGVVTLSSLRTLAQQRSNLENSQFVTDAEWNQYINDSNKELYDLVIQAYGDDYYSAYVDFSTDGQNQFYALPNGTNYSAARAFYKFLGLDLALSNTLDSFVRITNFAFNDRNRYSVPNFQSFYGVTNLRYRLNANNLWLTPVPQANQNLRLWYVPRADTLSSDTDTVDGYGGWTEYIVIDAAIKAMIKQELDISGLELQKSQMTERINSVANNRDAGNPAKVVDVAYDSMWWPGGNGNGSGTF